MSRGEDWGLAWTNERVETLRTRWLAGDTALAIANELGGVSRSAVLGKLTRLGLIRGRDITMVKDAMQRRYWGSATTPQERRREKNKRATAKIASRVNSTNPGTDSRVSIMELTPYSCRWPIGEPCSRSFCFCGAEAPEQPYCGYHQKIAFSN